MHDLPLRAVTIAGELKSTQRELEAAKAALAANKIDGLFENAQDVEGIKIMAAYFSGTGSDTLRSMCDKIRDKAPNTVAALVGASDGKITLAVSCGKNAQERGLKAGALVKAIAAVAGGNGGGKPDFAMAGIKDATKVDEALAAVAGIVRSALNG